MWRWSIEDALPLFCLSYVAMSACHAQRTWFAALSLGSFVSSLSQLPFFLPFSMTLFCILGGRFCCLLSTDNTSHNRIFLLPSLSWPKMHCICHSQKLPLSAVLQICPTSQLFSKKHLKQGAQSYCCFSVIHHGEHDGNRAWGSHADSYWLFQNTVN